MRNKVLIVGQDSSISAMFSRNGWNVTHNILDTDIHLVQFTGGEDVTPSLYKEKAHPATSCNPARDARESKVYLEFLGKAPMAGICRGAQFLNVMNGGSMWQHVGGHAIRGVHIAHDQMSGEPIMVTSTHHQMMIPSKTAIVLLTADQSSLKQGAETQEVGGVTPDIEALYYAETSCLCYQPHPEYVDIDHECQTTYFDYLSTFFNL
jgi:gamma-glutamyl-gamma-aminobutyrate hydrolase PuuD